MEEKFTMTIEPNYLDTACFLGSHLIEKTDINLVISFAEHVRYLTVQALENDENVTDLDTLMVHLATYLSR
jgi:hypothetical protein